MDAAPLLGSTGLAADQRIYQLGYAMESQVCVGVAAALQRLGTGLSLPMQSRMPASPLFHARSSSLLQGAGNELSFANTGIAYEFKMKDAETVEEMWMWLSGMCKSAGLQQQLGGYCLRELARPAPHLPLALHVWLAHPPTGPWLDVMLDANTTYPGSAPPAASGTVFGQNTLVGGIRIGQLRAKVARNCRTVEFPAESVAHSSFPCFGDSGEYSDAVEDTAPFGTGPVQFQWDGQGWGESAWSVAYDRSWMLNLAGTRSPTNAQYSSGAFPVIIPRNNITAARQLLQHLVDWQYTDAQTRVVTIDYTVYNANIDYFNVVTLQFELPVSGGVIPFYDYYSARMYTLFESRQPLSIVAESAVIACFFMFATQVLSRAYKYGQAAIHRRRTRVNSVRQMSLKHARGRNFRGDPAQWGGASPTSGRTKSSIRRTTTISQRVKQVDDLRCLWLTGLLGALRSLFSLNTIIMNANVVVFALVWIFRGWSWYALPDQDSVRPTSSTFYNFKVAASLRMMAANLNAANSFLCWMKLTKFLNDLTGNLVMGTITKAFPSLVKYFLVLAVTYLAFMTAFLLAFGTKAGGFANMSQSGMSLFVALMGDNVQFDHLEAASWLVGPVFMVLFVFLGVWVVLQILLAIILDAYTETRHELQLRPQVRVCREFKWYLLRCMARAGPRGRKMELACRPYCHGKVMQGRVRAALADLRKFEGASSGASFTGKMRRLSRAVIGAIRPSRSSTLSSGGVQVAMTPLSGSRGSPAGTPASSSTAPTQTVTTSAATASSATAAATTTAASTGGPALSASPPGPPAVAPGPPTRRATSGSSSNPELFLRRAESTTEIVMSPLVRDGLRRTGSRASQVYARRARPGAVVNPLAVNTDHERRSSSSVSSATPSGEGSRPDVA